VPRIDQTARYRAIQIEKTLKKKKVKQTLHQEVTNYSILVGKDARENMTESRVR
jgi:hypothetical protein